MGKLNEILIKKSRNVLGLMSGTSADGVDLALVHVDGYGLDTEIRLLKTMEMRYPREIRKKIMKILKDPQSPVQMDELCELDFKLGGFYAKCVIDFAKNSKADIDVVASHGQTVFHKPPNDGQGCSLQLGDGDVIAAKSGILTVSDFRRKDIALGGEGAPLVVYTDYILYRDNEKSIALNNLGGISNVTYIPKGSTIDDVIGFDTGPANALIDVVVRKFFNVPFDKDGKLSSKGKISKETLKELMKKEENYLSKKPPKSTGKEVYNEFYLKDFFSELSPYDLLRTVVEFTAWTIWRSYELYLFHFGVDKILLSGGGVKNETLVQSIRKYFENYTVETLPEWKFKEAVAFAILANELLNEVPANIPHVSGALRRTTLGKISLP